jgi:hypothetical protein
MGCSNARFRATLFCWGVVAVAGAVEREFPDLVFSTLVADDLEAVEADSLAVVTSRGFGFGGGSRAQTAEALARLPSALLMSP